MRHIVALAMALLLPLGSSCQSKQAPGTAGEPLAQRASALTVGEVTIDGVGVSDSASGSEVVTIFDRAATTNLGDITEHPLKLLVNSKTGKLNAVSGWRIVTNGVSASANASDYRLNPDGTSDIVLSVKSDQLDDRKASTSKDAECVPACQLILTDPATVDIIDVVACNNATCSEVLDTYSFSTIDTRNVDTSASGNGVCNQNHLDYCEGPYGSTYNSNCYCAFCTKYCDVNGITVKSGTCC